MAAFDDMDDLDFLEACSQACEEAESDFQRYKSGFYLDGLSSDEARSMMVKGIDALQSAQQTEAAALAGDYRLIYVTPEKLTSGTFLDRLATLHARQGLALLAVDEAHCVSQWGHDFRPSFAEIGAFRRRIPDVPIMALTATAVPRVQ
eukprot:gene30005-37456_t